MSCKATQSEYRRLNAVKANDVNVNIACDVQGDKHKLTHRIQRLETVAHHSIVIPRRLCPSNCMYSIKTVRLKGTSRLPTLRRTLNRSDQPRQKWSRNAAVQCSEKDDSFLTSLPWQIIGGRGYCRQVAPLGGQANSNRVIATRCSRLKRINDLCGLP